MNKFEQLHVVGFPMWLGRRGGSIYVAHTSIGKRAVGFLKGFLAYCETYLLVSATEHIE